MTSKLKKSIQPVLIGMLFLLGTTLKAQDFGQILAAGSEDANTYINSYLKPAMNSMGNGLANGWYNTGRAHKTLGVDITASVNVARIDEAERLFTFLESDYINLLLEPGNNNSLPTMVGGEAPPGEELVIPAGTVDFFGQPVTTDEDIRFAVPDGIDITDFPITGLPIPTAQIGIGIYKSTDLKIRFVPEISTDNFRMRMFGIGVLHDVKQWIPVIKNLPFDLSGFFGTTTFSAETDIEVDEQSGGGSTSFYGSGVAEISATSTTIQAIISKKLLVFTPYAAIGVNMVKSDMALKGEYTYEVASQTATVQDPVDLEFTNAGGPRFTIGGRLKLAVFTFHFDYTAQRYNTMTAGVGISVR